MWKKIFYKCVISSLSLVCLLGNAPMVPQRVSAQFKDLGHVHPVFMVPGMATILEIPTPITGVRIGNPEFLSAHQPNMPLNELTLVLKSADSKPTNLIIRSNEKKYVFDIVPNKSVHQDVVEIVGSYGGAKAGYLAGTSKLIDSSDRK